MVSSATQSQQLDVTECFSARGSYSSVCSFTRDKEILLSLINEYTIFLCFKSRKLHYNIIRRLHLTNEINKQANSNKWTTDLAGVQKQL